MFQHDSVIDNLQHWGDEQDSVKARILTGSKANPNTVTDIFSDYDVQLFVKDIESYMVDDRLTYFSPLNIALVIPEVWELRTISKLSK